MTDWQDALDEIVTDVKGEVVTLYGGSIASLTEICPAVGELLVEAEQAIGWLSLIANMDDARSDPRVVLMARKALESIAHRHAGIRTPAPSPPEGE